MHQIRSAAGPAARPCYVAIPAKNEADRIIQCLTALGRQRHLPDHVILLVNNSTDTTAAIAQDLISRLPYRLQVLQHDLPPDLASAGHARRVAMDCAAELAGSSGILLTTDADTILPPGWIGANLAAVEGGADAVCGQAAIDPADAALIPAHLRDDDALERELILLNDRLAWTLDPEPHDPPPRHTEASGASIAVTAAAFHRVGGVPAIPSGEDRALIRAIWEQDGKVRHDPAISVLVSGRMIGRAAGGMAETIRRRMVAQDEFTDQQLEPPLDAWRRYALRRRVRMHHRGAADAPLAADLAVLPGVLRQAMQQRSFGAAWRVLEDISPVLVRQRVRFAELGMQIGVARSLLTPETMAAD